MSEIIPERIGVIGLGLLGRGIVSCLLAHGKKVVAFSNDDRQFPETRKHIETALRELVDRADFSPAILDQCTDLYTEAGSIEQISGCDFVIESVTEDLQVKRAVLDQIEQALEAMVPIATNTSGFSLAELQQSMRQPERLVGMHWAEPAHVTRFMELVRGERTHDAAMISAIALARSVGKDPCVLNRDIPGLIVNRLAYAMYREAFHLLQLGVADVETIDRAFRNAFGIWASVAGPFRWMDLTGIPAYAQVMEHLWPTLSNTSEPPQLMRNLVSSGAQGIASLRGFYRYTDEEAHHWKTLVRENAWHLRDLQVPPP